MPESRGSHHSGIWTPAFAGVTDAFAGVTDAFAGVTTGT